MSIFIKNGQHLTLEREEKMLIFHRWIQKIYWDMKNNSFLKFQSWRKNQQHQNEHNRRYGNGASSPRSYGWTFQNNYSFTGITATVLDYNFKQLEIVTEYQLSDKVKTLYI